MNSLASKRAGGEKVTKEFASQKRKDHIIAGL
jgi:hypothetical protein